MGMFQSLFSWNLLSNRRWWLHPIPSTRVSILVFVELALEQPFFEHSEGIQAVSILVFVELALEHVIKYLLGYRYKFQSLFSWNLLSNASVPAPVSANLIVSILVFVELALERLFHLVYMLKLYRFNPCFRGTCSRTKKNKTPDKTCLSFNPCFRGTCSRTPVGRFCSAEFYDVSILVFVELALELGLIWLLDPRIICFNPCFRGTCSRTPLPGMAEYTS